EGCPRPGRPAAGAEADPLPAIQGLLGLHPAEERPGAGDSRVRPPARRPRQGVTHSEADWARTANATRPAGGERSVFRRPAMPTNGARNAESRLGNLYWVSQRPS